VKTIKQHESFMLLALKQAVIAGQENEVPIGAVITRDDEVIAIGHNKREASQNALMHAEIDAINEACKKLKSWRLSGCTIYVTLEPCPMCAGAIINSRIDTVVFGAADLKAGACGSVIDLFACPFNHRPTVVKNILNTQCINILKEFFSKLRIK
jgi:tRNA(adenine34) deaminase